METLSHELPLIIALCLAVLCAFIIGPIKEAQEWRAFTRSDWARFHGAMRVLVTVVGILSIGVTALSLLLNVIRFARTGH